MGAINILSAMLALTKNMQVKLTTHPLHKKHRAHHQTPAASYPVLAALKHDDFEKMIAV